VTAPVRARLDALVISHDDIEVPVRAVRCEAIWLEGDPVSVTVRFEGDGLVVDWEFSRDLLAAGLSAPAGVGDVRIWSGFRGLEKVMNLRLSSHEGTAVVQMPARQVELFLAATEAVVAVGAERVDMDGLLARIFAEAS
jgi:hypothetical protein